MFQCRQCLVPARSKCWGCGVVSNAYMHLQAAGARADIAGGGGQDSGSHLRARVRGAHDGAPPQQPPCTQQLGLTPAFECATSVLQHIGHVPLVARPCCAAQNKLHPKVCLQESFRQLYREGGLEDNTITIDVPPNTSGAGGIVGSDGPMGGTVSSLCNDLCLRIAVRTKS